MLLWGFSPHELLVSQPLLYYTAILCLVLCILIIIIITYLQEYPHHNNNMTNNYYSATIILIRLSIKCLPTCIIIASCGLTQKHRTTQSNSCYRRFSCLSLGGLSPLKLFFFFFPLPLSWKLLQLSTRTSRFDYTNHTYTVQ